MATLRREKAAARLSLWAVSAFIQTAPEVMRAIRRRWKARSISGARCRSRPFTPRVSASFITESRVSCKRVTTATASSTPAWADEAKERTMRTAATITGRVMVLQQDRDMSDYAYWDMS